MQLEGAQQEAETEQDQGSRQRQLQKQLQQLKAEGQALAGTVAALCSQALGLGTSQSVLHEIQRCLQRWGSSFVLSYPAMCASWASQGPARRHPGILRQGLVPSAS